MRPPARYRVWVAASVLALSQVCAAAQIQFAPRAVVRFASAAEGREILGRADDYFIRMSAFDRMLRLRTDREVTDAEYREVVVRNVTDWPDEDRRQVESALEALAGGLAGLKLPLPPRVWMVRTTGVGDVGDGYTRPNAIVLPAHSMSVAPERLQRLLAHEMFHVMTRHDARFREQAYGTIGFRLCEHVELPASLATRRLTNPDALQNDAYVEVSVNATRVPAIPVLLSRSDRFDPKLGVAISDYWTMRLMVVEPVDGAGRMRPVIANGEPLLLQSSQVKGFFEQIGRNTDYIVHPEEILADHFALLATGAAARQPEYIDRLRALLQGR